MGAIFLVLGGILLNYVVGCVVLCWLDDSDYHLFYWFKDNPLKECGLPQTGFFICMELWPIFAFVIIRDKVKGE